MYCLKHSPPETLLVRRIRSGLTDHKCLQQIRKIGETKPRIQRRMEFPSAYNFSLSYRRGKDNANADFFYPDSPSLPLTRISPVLAPSPTQTTSASTSPGHAASCPLSVLSPVLAWMGSLPHRVIPQASPWVGSLPRRVIPQASPWVGSLPGRVIPQASPWVG